MGAGAWSRPSSASSQFPCGSSASTAKAPYSRRPSLARPFIPRRPKRSIRPRNAIVALGTPRSGPHLRKRRKKTVVVPEAEHEIEIGRLYGVDFLRDRSCAIHSPFDLMAPPVPLDAWLDAKALQVNSVSYTVKDALGLVADYEGAHTNELPAWVAVGVNPEDVDKGRNMKYRLVNSVYFGCLSYVHVVTLYTALYVTGQMQQLLAKSGNTLAGVDASAVERSIRHIRTDLVLRARIINGTHEMIVTGKSDVPGHRRRRPLYRFWSGSPKWDAPVPDPVPPRKAETVSALRARGRGARVPVEFPTTGQPSGPTTRGRFINDPSGQSLKTLRAQIFTSVGQTVEVKPETGLVNRLRLVTNRAVESGA